MTTCVYATFMLDAGSGYEASAQLSTDGRQVIGAVHVDPYGMSRMAVQTTEINALREFAAALIDAADKADLLASQRAVTAVSA